MNDEFTRESITNHFIKVRDGPVGQDMRELVRRKTRIKNPSDDQVVEWWLEQSYSEESIKEVLWQVVKRCSNTDEPSFGEKCKRLWKQYLI